MINKLSTKATDRLIFFFFFISAVILVSFIGTKVAQQYKTNETYTRFTACILSVPPKERTKDSIDNCRTRVAEDTGVEIKRYDIVE